MINEIFKNPTIVKLNYNMICSIKTKFTNKITTGDYIIERIVREKIYNGFLYKSENINKLNKLNKLDNYANSNDKFNLTLNCNEKYAGYSAFTYSILNKKPGILITNSNNGFQDIIEPIYKAHVSKYPMFVISLYNKNERVFPSKIESLVIKSHDITTTHRFPHIFEYLFEKSFSGPTHLKINHEFLSEKIDLDHIQYNAKIKK